MPLSGLTDRDFRLFSTKVARRIIASINQALNSFQDCWYHVYPNAEETDLEHAGGSWQVVDEATFDLVGGNYFVKSIVAARSFVLSRSFNYRLLVNGSPVSEEFERELPTIGRVIDHPTFLFLQDLPSGEVKFTLEVQVPSFIGNPEMRVTKWDLFVAETNFSEA